MPMKPQPDDTQVGVDVTELSNLTPVDDADLEETDEEVNSATSNPPNSNVIMQTFSGWIAPCKTFLSTHKRTIKRLFMALLILLYFAFLVSALVLNFCRSFALLIMTLLVLVYVVYAHARDRWGPKIRQTYLKPCLMEVKPSWRYVKWLVLLGALLCIGLFLGLETAKQPEQLISIGGYATILLICFVCSKHPGQVKWRPVIWGLALQFCLGLFVLRTSIGFEAFNFLGQKFEGFIEFADEGSAFVFGDLPVVTSPSGNLTDLTLTKAFLVHNFVFQVMPTVVFFATVTSVLYHLGWMQFVIHKLAWLMQLTLGISGPEAISAAGSIFLGLTDCAMLVRPFLPTMTNSELFTVMTAGFASIAGSVLAAFTTLGISASFLLTANVMAAPTSLALSKLVYPETDERRHGNKKDDRLNIKISKDRNLLEAVSAGASMGVSIVAHIVGNLIAFLSFLAFINTVLTWLGGMVNIQDLTFQTICSYVFMPLAFLAGVPWEDCRVVAELFGTKTFLNEFVAYVDMSNIIKGQVPGKTLQHPRSVAIATFALCGFANFGSIGIQLGGMGIMAPGRRGDLADVALRSMLTGAMVGLLNACMAGLLYQDPLLSTVSTLNGTALLNSTQSCQYTGTLLYCMC
ncbi:sodium/nucleoside cotransporter 1-like isoform X1 [Branchiostoma lanceolatum]|uniref:sodium/nucleoside cotransporter 1-like isoform X1 n=1 Tax=Branchiostoma lanceolatum TaxID=7740 RepID=UPI0034568A42